MNTAMGEASYPVYGSVKWKPDLPGRGRPRRCGARATSTAAPPDVHDHADRDEQHRLDHGVYMAGVRRHQVPRGWCWALAGRDAHRARLRQRRSRPWAVLVKVDSTFAYIFRFGMMPLMLFSGTFFPLVAAFPRLAPPGRLRHAAVGTASRLCRGFSLGNHQPALGPSAHVTLPGRCWAAAGIWAGRPHLPQEALCLASPLRMLPPAGLLARLRRAGGDAGSLRAESSGHARAYRHALAGVSHPASFEPPVLPAVRGTRPGAVLVGKVPGPRRGALIPYREVRRAPACSPCPR